MVNLTIPHKALVRFQLQLTHGHCRSTFPILVSTHTPLQSLIFDASAGKSEIWAVRWPILAFSHVQHASPGFIYDTIRAFVNDQNVASFRWECIWEHETSAVATIISSIWVNPSIWCSLTLLRPFKIYRFVFFKSAEASIRLWVACLLPNAGRDHYEICMRFITRKSFPNTKATAHSK